MLTCTQVWEPLTHRSDPFPSPGTSPTYLLYFLPPPITSKHTELLASSQTPLHFLTDVLGAETLKDAHCVAFSLWLRKSLYLGLANVFVLGELVKLLMDGSSGGWEKRGSKPRGKKRGRRGQNDGFSRSAFAEHSWDCGTPGSVDPGLDPHSKVSIAIKQVVIFFLLVEGLPFNL